MSGYEWQVPDYDLLVGRECWTVDHVRRRIVEIDGHMWVDEYGIETSIDAIDRVILDGTTLATAEDAAELLAERRW